jgi:ferredoxin--NADP+ reductase
LPEPGTHENPLRVAIIGAGPSGFYAAEQILKDPETEAQVDLFDRLPTPYGLVRGGVAPDHPKIKSVTRVYERTAAKEGFRFFGNVEVGRDLNIADFESHYHAVMYTFGAEADRELGIPGEDLPGSYAATAFVGWYNAHPDYADREFGLDAVRRAVVIGNGNVAMDVSRMLALDEAELRRTDIADHAIDVLAGSAIEEIVVLGRRGPAQAAYTNPEIKELGELEEADVIVDPADVLLDPDSRAWIDSDDADKTARVNVEIVEEFSRREPTGKPKKIRLRFLSSPVEIRGGERVESIVIARNELKMADGSLRAIDTGEREELECQLVLRSVGYTGVPLRGVPFDEKRGTILNDEGRVLDSHGGEHRTGHYTAGWIKRGPSGVIGTNKKDAQETVTHLLEDVASGRLLSPADPGPEAIENLLAERKAHFVSFSGWEKIDHAEVTAGQPHERPRVKFVEVDQMLQVASGSGPDDTGSDRAETASGGS